MLLVLDMCGATSVLSLDSRRPSSVFGGAVLLVLNACGVLSFDSRRLSSVFGGTVRALVGELGLLIATTYRSCVTHASFSANDSSSLAPWTFS